jgi:oligopeptide/dipeptide ABC transporter ATP-binding protein
MDTLLKIDNLKIQAKEPSRDVTLVEGVSFELKAGETLGVVGESGCGKSMTALSIAGLLRKHISISEGSIMFEGYDLTQISKSELRGLCGKEIGFVFQEPMTALNPMFKIGKQIAEPLRKHLKMTKDQARLRSIALLEEVGIKDAETVINCYPHQFSGGMRQRVLIAMAIACGPKLLIADEPTTALDVITQAQILKLLKRLIKEHNMALLIISHDLGVIAQLSERVLVMYAGQVVEESIRENLVNAPKHPYTERLLSAAKEMTSDCSYLTVVKGGVPRPEDEVLGCKFAERCTLAKDGCKASSPPMVSSGGGYERVKCWQYDERYQAWSRE